MLQGVRIVVAGRVQGVAFRMSACSRARELGLTGWVRNLADGSVEAVAEGDSEQLGDFILWCGRGPSMAMVTGIRHAFIPYSGNYKSFDVRQ